MAYHAHPQPGDSSGELSLVSTRPLWYSMSVLSAEATVLSLDLDLIRAFLKTALSAPASDGAHGMRHEDAMAAAEVAAAAGSAVVHRVLGSVSDVDTELYSCAVQQQALGIQVGATC